MIHLKHIPFETLDTPGLGLVYDGRDSGSLYQLEPIVREPILSDPIVREPIVREPIVREPIQPISSDPLPIIKPEPILVTDPIYQPTQPDDRDQIYQPISIEPAPSPITREPIVREPIVREPIQPISSYPLPIIKPEPILVTDPIYQPTQPDDREPIVSDPIVKEPVKPVKNDPLPIIEPDPVEPIKPDNNEVIKPQTRQIKIGGMSFNSFQLFGGVLLTSFVAYKAYEKYKNN